MREFVLGLHTILQANPKLFFEKVGTVDQRRNRNKKKHRIHSTAAPSSLEDVSLSPDVIDILSSDGTPDEMLGAPWDEPAKQDRAFAA